MNKKRVALMVFGFLALCAAQSLIALDRALNERDAAAGITRDA